MRQTKEYCATGPETLIVEYNKMEKQTIRQQFVGVTLKMSSLK